MKANKADFQFRARICGIVDWLCGFCGHLNRSRVTRTTWRVQCAGKDCRRWFAVGVILRTLPRAGRPPLPPPDIVFPAAELDHWESGEPVNRLIPDAQQDGDTHDETLP